MSPTFTPPAWLPGGGRWGGHAHTLWGARMARRTASGEPPLYRRERWITPDGDFIDADWHEPAQPGQAEPPLLVLFHGLEGSSSSHYAQAFASVCAQRGWRFVMPHFRGCSGGMNLAPRAYHSGDFEEIGWMLAQCRSAHAGPLWAAGVSLGGNALLRWAQEAGSQAQRCVKGVAAVSAPLDVAASGHALARGVNRQLYTRLFLRTMKPKALQKWDQHPGLFCREALIKAQDVTAFDDAFTAPLHGFKGVDDYWRRASSRPHLARLMLPSLVLNALNDPLVPATSLPLPHEVSPLVSLWQPHHGGHVGFPVGRWPGQVLSLPQAVLDWMVAHG